MQRWQQCVKLRKYLQLTHRSRLIRSSSQQQAQQIKCVSRWQKMAVEETGMGIVEDKVIKNNYASEYIYNAYKNTQTVGVVEEDKEYGIKKIAEPIGLVAAVIPTTNPTSTAIFKTLISLKTRNAIIISPHPRSKKEYHRSRKGSSGCSSCLGAPEKGSLAGSMFHLWIRQMKL